MSGRAWVRLTVSVFALAIAAKAPLADPVSLPYAFPSACPMDTVAGTSTDARSATNTHSSGFGSYSGSYDLMAGTLGGNASGIFYSSYQLVEATDEYTVTGPPAGTVLIFALEIGITGQYHGHAGATVIASTDHGYNIGSVRASGPTPANLRLPISVTVNTPFHIRYAISALLAGDVESMSVSRSVTFHFSGLPFSSLLAGGARVQSCQGYDQATVAADTPTWGQLKIRYR